MRLLKKYWDIFGGLISTVIISILAKFELERIQLIYSIIILLLVSIGVFRIIKQAVEKQQGKKAQKRSQTLIDSAVDAQKSVKAISLAQNPTKEGEKLGLLILETLKRGKRKMKKIKKWFDKFKGIIFAIALWILSVAEYCGAFLNTLLGDKLIVNGVNVLAVIIAGAGTIVGIVSKPYTAEQLEKIKTLFQKSTTDEIVIVHIKKTIKEDEAQLKEFNKQLANKETELDNLNSLLESAKNDHRAKEAMFNMIPRLATIEDVRNAAASVSTIEANIVAKQKEINLLQADITSLTETIATLKSKL